jgi:chromosome segregation ATPase
VRWLEGATSGLAQDLDGVLSFAAGHQQRASELQHELELSQADALAAGRRVADLESELTAALDRTAGAEARTEQVTARVLELERELESARDAHENKLRELRLRLVRAEVRPSQPATSTEANVQRLADHEQVGELQAELARAKLQAAQTAARMASLERELEQAAKTYERELVGLRTRLETRASQLESQLGRERVTHEAQLQGLQAQLADARQRASTSFGRIHHLEQRLTAATTSSAALKVAVETLRSDASKSRTQAIELERELKQERETRQVQMQELQSALEAERIKAAAARADLEAALQELAGGPMLAAAASGSGTPVAASARRPEKVRAGQSPDMLDGLRQAAETRARRHASRRPCAAAPTGRGPTHS